jgi:hypothetical protein
VTSAPYQGRPSSMRRTSNVLARDRQRPGVDQRLAHGRDVIRRDVDDEATGRADRWPERCGRARRRAREPGGLRSAARARRARPFVRGPSTGQHHVLAFLETHRRADLVEQQRLVHLGEALLRQLQQHRRSRSRAPASARAGGPSRPSARPARPWPGASDATSLLSMLCRNFWRCGPVNGQHGAVVQKGERRALARGGVLRWRSAQARSCSPACLTILGTIAA